MYRYIKADTSSDVYDLIFDYIQDRVNFEINYYQWDSSVRGGYGDLNLFIGRDGYQDATFDIDIQEFDRIVEQNGDRKAAEIIGKMIVKELKSYQWEKAEPYSEDDHIEYWKDGLIKRLNKIFTPSGEINYLSLANSRIHEYIQELESLGKSNIVDQILADYGTSLDEIEHLESQIIEVNPHKFLTDNGLDYIFDAGSTWYAFADTGKLLPELEEQIIRNSKEFDGRRAKDGSLLYESSDKVIDAINSYDFRNAEGRWDPYINRKR